MKFAEVYGDDGEHFDMYAGERVLLEEPGPSGWYLYRKDSEEPWRAVWVDVIRDQDAGKWITCVLARYGAKWEKDAPEPGQWLGPLQGSSPEIFEALNDECGHLHRGPGFVTLLHPGPRE